MDFKPNDTVYDEFTTSNPFTMAAQNADSLPVGTVQRNGTDDGAVTVTVTNVDTGRYKLSFTSPSGYAKGDVVVVTIAATVASVAGKAKVWRDKLGDGVALSAAQVATVPTSGTLARTTDIVSAAAVRTEIDSNSTQLAAILTAVNNLNNLSALANLSGSPLLEIPLTGSSVFPFVLTIRDSEGHLVDLDAMPTLALVNAAGTTRAGYLSSPTRASLGVYQFTITIASTATSEGLGLTATGAVASSARRCDFGVNVVDYDQLTMLSNIYAKVVNLPSDPTSETNATSNRNTITAAIVTPPTAAQVRAEMDTNSTKLANLDVLLSTRASETNATSNRAAVISAFVTPPTAVQIRQEMDSNSTKLANLDVVLSTRASETNATSNKTAILNEIDNIPGGGGGGGSGLTAAQTRAALGMANADLDTQLDAILAAASSGGGGVGGGTPGIADTVEAHTGVYGLTGVTATLYPDDVAEPDATAIVCASDDRPGCYTFDNPALSGMHLVQLWMPGKLKPFWYGWVNLSIAGTVKCFNDPPGNFTVDLSGTPPYSIVIPQSLSVALHEPSGISVIRGDTLRVALPAVGDLTSRSKLVLTVKSNVNDMDQHSILQIVEGTGLVRLNGGEVPSPGTAALTVRDAESGEVNLEIDASVTAELAVSDFVWDMQIHAPTGIQTPLIGTISVVADVTQSVT